jgi:hypothetical protein
MDRRDLGDLDLKRKNFEFIEREEFYIFLIFL